MKKRIFYTLCLISFLGVIVAAGITTSISTQFHMKQLESNLQETAQSVAKSYKKLHDLEDIKVVLGSLSDDIRATLIDAQGNILYETATDAEGMENHLNRPEIQNAISDGSGESSRESQTTHTKTYYYAVRLADGMILRLARAYSNMYHVVLNSVLFIGLWSVILVIFAVILSRRMTVWLIRPVVHLADHITNFEDAEVYDELAPFIRHIREQNDRIDQQENTLQKGQETLDIITREMKEGMLLIGNDRNVASINPSAITMMTGEKIKESRFTGRTFLLLNRTSVWYECVNQALEGENAKAELMHEGKVLRVYTSPIMHEGRVDGAVVIIVDVTQQRLAEKARQEFSANVSHELKTPLTSISGYAEMMELGMVEQEEDRIEFARRIHKEAMRLIALINDIIRLSRIEEGALQEFQIIELHQICLDSGERLQQVASKAKVSIQVQGQPLLIRGEKGMIIELIYNLCENAVKYNREGGHVWVTTKRSGEEALIEVKDDGIGIPEEATMRVFERFYRVDKSRSKQTGGTGLGLSIVKHIVEFHNGRIELKSKLGEGTCIRVWLPLPPVQPM